MNRNKIVFAVGIVVFLIVVVVLLNAHNNPNEKGIMGNLLAGNILTTGTVTTTAPSGSTVTKETPSTWAADGFVDSSGVWHDTTQPGQSSGPHGGPGRSTVFPDNDRGMVHIGYNDKNGKIENPSWFPGDIGSFTNSPYGNPFNHLFPVDSTGKPTDPSGVISHATTSAYGTLPPQSQWNKDDYKYTDRPGMPSPSTRTPTGTTSAYGTLPVHSDWKGEYKYTDRPGMPSPSTRTPTNTSSAYGTLPSHTDQHWMYTDRPVI